MTKKTVYCPFCEAEYVDGYMGKVSAFDNDGDEIEPYECFCGAWFYKGMRNAKQKPEQPLNILSVV